MDIRAKGNLGIRFTWLAALAFVLCIFGQTLLLGLLLGFVVVTEHNDWLSYQVLSAFLLSLFSALVSAVNSVLSGLYSIPLLGSVVSTGVGLVLGICSLVVFILAILGAVKAAKGDSANIPVVSKLAASAFQVMQQQYQQQAQYQQYQQYQQPQYQEQPQQPQYQEQSYQDPGAPRQ